MNGYLLDAHIALRATVDPALLSAKARRAIERGPVFLSVISYWQVLLKSMKGKLKVGDPRTWWQDALEQLAATPLLVRPEHIHEISSLPLIHLDPFDRALIAQAQVENLVLVTTDGRISEYAGKRLQVLE